MLFRWQGKSGQLVFPAFATEPERACVAAAKICWWHRARADELASPLPLRPASSNARSGYSSVLCALRRGLPSINFQRATDSGAMWFTSVERSGRAGRAELADTLRPATALPVRGGWCDYDANDGVKRPDLCQASAREHWFCHRRHRNPFHCSTRERAARARVDSDYEPATMSVGTLFCKGACKDVLIFVIVWTQIMLPGWRSLRRRSTNSRLSWSRNA